MHSEHRLRLLSSASLLLPLSFFVCVSVSLSHTHPCILTYGSKEPGKTHTSTHSHRDPLVPTHAHSDPHPLQVTRTCTHNLARTLTDSHSLHTHSPTLTPHPSRTLKHCHTLPLDDTRTQRPPGPAPMLTFTLALSRRPRPPLPHCLGTEQSPRLRRRRRSRGGRQTPRVRPDGPGTDLRAMRAPLPGAGAPSGRGQPPGQHPPSRGLGPRIVRPGWLGLTVPSVRPAVRLLSLGRRSVRPSVRHRRRGAASCTATPRRMQEAPPRPEPPPLPPSLRAVTRAPALRRAPAPAPTRAAAAVPAPPARPPPLHFPAPGPGAGSRPRAAPSLLPATNAPDPLVPSGPLHPLCFPFSILYWSSRLPFLLRHGLLLPHCPVLSRPFTLLYPLPFPLLSALSVYSLPPSNPPHLLTLFIVLSHLFLGLLSVTLLASHLSLCFISPSFPLSFLPSSRLPSFLLLTYYPVLVIPVFISALASHSFGSSSVPNLNIEIESY